MSTLWFFFMSPCFFYLGVDQPTFGHVTPSTQQSQNTPSHLFCSFQLSFHHITICHFKLTTERTSCKACVTLEKKAQSSELLFNSVGHFMPAPPTENNKRVSTLSTVAGIQARHMNSLSAPAVRVLFIWHASHTNVFLCICVNTRHTGIPTG